MNRSMADALLAVRLLARMPGALGGLCLRGDGLARERVVAALQGALPAGTPFLRLPGHIDDDRLAGGIDIAASLAAGVPVHEAGLLDRARGGVLVVPMAERLRADLAGRVAQAMDRDGGFMLVLLDDGAGPDERASAALVERVAFDLAFEGVTAADLAAGPADGAGGAEAIVRDDGEAAAALAATAQALGIASMRPLLQGLAAARAHAGLAGRAAIAAEDIEAAVRLVLAPRSTQWPEAAPEPPSEPPEQPGEADSQRGDDDDAQALPDDLQSLMIEAARAAIPPDVLAALAAGRAPRRAQGGGGGRKGSSARRGRPLGARPGMPGGGKRLALVDTLRAALPWQALRRREPAPAGSGALRFRREDLRIRRFEERSTTLTLFCVDASGSAALSRLAEAKGAAERILAQAYVQRSEVAVVAFRGEAAELLLPPTRSLTRAKRALAALPGGGGTPLASGIAMTRQVAETVAARGCTPLLVFMTDGCANIALDGGRGRARAQDDALAAARTLAGAGLDAVVIDISPRPRPEAAQLAEAMRGRYLPLPNADSAALHAAVALAAPAPQRVAR